MATAEGVSPVADQNVGLSSPDPEARPSGPGSPPRIPGDAEAAEPRQPRPDPPEKHWTRPNGICISGCCSCLCVCAIVQLILAASTAHTIGVVWAVVLMATVILTSVCCYGLQFVRAFQIGEVRTRFGVNCGVCLLTCPIISITMFLFLVNLISLGTDPGWEEFPEACEQEFEIYGCTRVSVDRPQRGEGLKPVFLAGDSLLEVKDRLHHWFDDAPNWPERCEWMADSVRPAASSDSSAVRLFVRAKCFTSTYNFIDDFAGRLTEMGCTSGEPTGVLVEGHSEQRIGAGDMMVNDHRMNALWTYLRAQRQRTPHTCDNDWEVEVVN